MNTFLFKQHGKQAKASEVRLCACGCGSTIDPKIQPGAMYKTNACRGHAYLQRRKAREDRQKAS